MHDFALDWLFVSTQHAWINHTILCKAQIMLDATKFWVYQIFFHYDYSWFMSEIW